MATVMFIRKRDADQRAMLILQHVVESQSHRRLGMAVVFMVDQKFFFRSMPVYNWPTWAS